MDVTTLFLGMVLGICIVLFILFFIRDAILKHYLTLISDSGAVRPVLDPERLITSVSSYITVLETTSDLFSDLISDNALGDVKVVNTIVHTRDSVNDQVKVLKIILNDLQRNTVDDNR